MDKESAPTNQEVPSYVQVVGAVYRNSDPSDIAVTAAGGLVGEVYPSLETKRVKYSRNRVGF